MKSLELLSCAALITSIIIALVANADAQSPPAENLGGGSDVFPVTSISHAVSFGRDGLLFSNEDSSNQVRVHGYLQADGRFFSSDLKDESPDKLLFRRIRPLLEGTLLNVLDFRLMPDFGQNNPQIQEAYVELKPIAYAKPRIGKFKAPFGLEVLRPDRYETFAERSLASDLVPLREIGAQIAGSVSHDSFTYAIGYFNGTPDGSNGTFQWRSSTEAAGRVFLRPFAALRVRPLRGIGLGIAASLAQEHGTLPRFKTVGQNTFFKYSSTAVADGPHKRLSPQAYYYWGPLGALAEYTVSAQQVRNQTDLRRLNNDGWQVTTSVMLTGEKNSYAGIRPRHTFEPQRGIRHLGAWELAGRISCLQVDRNAFPVFADPQTGAAGAIEWAVAVNWYLNGFARIMNAYEHTRFEMAMPRVDPLHGENLVMSRIQLAF